MDYVKIGGIIARLRKEKGFTQQNLADALSVSNKTVSKWECGVGCPDVSLLGDLSNILGVDMAQMVDGEITPNRPDSGNMNKVRFYVCPICSNVIVSTGSASMFCCGKRLEALQEQGEKLQITVEAADVDYYITFDHEMTREHYILFAAYVKDDRYFLNRLYPEQPSAVRMPQMIGGKLYLYCPCHGLTSHKISV